MVQEDSSHRGGVAVATFVILPPRELLEHAIHGSVEALLPGFPVPPGLWERILGEVIVGSEVHPLHREDLPESDDIGTTLAEGFGAEPGDHVVETSLPRGRDPGPVRTWRVPGTASPWGAGR